MPSASGACVHSALRILPSAYEVAACLVDVDLLDIMITFVQASEHLESFQTGWRGSMKTLAFLQHEKMDASLDV